MFNQILYILIPFSFYLIIGQSFSLIYYPTKIFHIAHAIILTLGAYFVYLFAIYLSISLPLSIIIAIVLTTLIGIFCEVFIFRYMRKKNTSAFSYLIASLGFYIFLQNMISLFAGDDVKTINISDITVGTPIFGAYITTLQIISICISFFLFVSIKLILYFTQLGKSIRAVSSNPELSKIYGINSNKVIFMAFGLGSATASIAGILYAFDNNMTPTFGFNLLLFAVVALIIGGIGSTRGIIAGSLLVAAAQYLSTYYLEAKWMEAITYLILILFLIWKPLGFSGILLKKIEV